MAEDVWRALALQVADGRGPWRLPTEPPTRSERMLALTARTRLTEDDASQARALGEQLTEREWHQMMTLARVGYVDSLVYAQIAAIGLLPLLPSAIYASFADRYRETLLENLRIRTALEHLLDQLATAGIAAVPLKGVTLAERLYTNIGWRPTRDIDLLVRREDIRPIARLLLANGYHTEYGQEDAYAFEAIATTETKYERKDAPVVELHWGLSKRPTYRRGLATASIWARTVTAIWRGRTIRVLAPADELRFLAVHCTADHQHSQLNWLVDIAELVGRLPSDWSWSAFTAETIATGLATPVGLAMAQCRAMLRLEIPDEPLVETLRAGLSAEEQAAWQSAWATRLSRRWIAAHLRAISSRRERARFAAGALARVAAKTTNARRRRITSG
ncbi:MAG TPA: nucleotidyltransferase family protein [Ktedonobacterales bacterium]|nr:nucleotidyltransferase family protein [Ktedonobacterales bacterium]